MRAKVAVIAIGSLLSDRFSLSLFSFTASFAVCYNDKPSCAFAGRCCRAPRVDHASY